MLHSRYHASRTGSSLVPSMNPRLTTQTDARGILTVTLQVPDRRNAFDAALVTAMTAAFAAASSNPDVRVVVLRGCGPVFCAGGDIEWMRQCGAGNPVQRHEYAAIIADLFSTVDQCRKPTVAVVQGAAIGGAVGLLAACDIVIAERQAAIGMSEGTLGIVPACAAPVVMAKIGVSHARRLFLTGIRITALEAQSMGLVHQVVPTAADLDAALEATLKQLLTISPEAQRTAKGLLRELQPGLVNHTEAVRKLTVDVLCESWASDDGQEGMAAFLEKRPPRWNRPVDDGLVTQ